MVTKMVRFFAILLLIFGLIMGGSLIAQDDILVFNTQSVIAQTSPTRDNYSVEELKTNWANVKTDYDEFKTKLNEFVTELEQKQLTNQESAQDIQIDDSLILNTQTALTDFQTSLTTFEVKLNNSSLEQKTDFTTEVKKIQDNIYQLQEFLLTPAKNLLTIEEVKTLQNKLKGLNVGDNIQSVDGHFGENTVNALKKWVDDYKIKGIKDSINKIDVIEQERKSNNSENGDDLSEETDENQYHILKKIGIFLLVGLVVFCLVLVLLILLRLMVKSRNELKKKISTLEKSVDNLTKDNKDIKKQNLEIKEQLKNMQTKFKELKNNQQNQVYQPQNLPTSSYENSSYHCNTTLITNQEPSPSLNPLSNISGDIKITEPSPKVYEVPKQGEQIKVNLTQETINQGVSGIINSVVLEPDRKGYYLIIEHSLSYDYLDLVPNAKLNPQNLGIIKKTNLFECHGNLDNPTKFNVTILAKVRSITPGQKWELIEPGKLYCS